LSQILAPVPTIFLDILESCNKNYSSAALTKCCGSTGCGPSALVGEISITSVKGIAGFFSSKEKLFTVDIYFFTF
jgi:hypothetical protein